MVDTSNRQWCNTDKNMHHFPWPFDGYSGSKKYVDMPMTDYDIVTNVQISNSAHLEYYIEILNTETKDYLFGNCFNSGNEITSWYQEIGNRVCFIILLEQSQ